MPGPPGIPSCGGIWPKGLGADGFWKEIKMTVYEPSTTNKMTYVATEDSDHPGQLPIWSVFSVHLKKLGSLATHRAHSQDWEDAQADLSLCWTRFRHYIRSKGAKSYSYIIYDHQSYSWKIIGGTPRHGVLRDDTCPCWNNRNILGNEIPFNADT